MSMTAENQVTDQLASPEASGKAIAGNFSEDAWALLIGGFIIVAVLGLTVFIDGFTFTMPSWKWANASALTGEVLSLKNMVAMLQVGLVLAVLAGVAVWLSGGPVKKFLAGFALIFVLAVISLIIAGNEVINYYGLEYVIFALIIGLTIGNVTVIPSWLREAARSEFFIKTGLVIMGAGILFTDIIKAGLPGIVQAVLVVSTVWFIALWISRTLKVDDEFGVILASAVAICGVSAAIVASGAIQGDKKKLSYVSTLVLLVAIPMLVLQPWLIKTLHIPEIVGGAWLGGTLDTTASVAAAAQLVGPAATKTGVIIKFSQNILIGVAAFFIAIWWAYRKVQSSGDKTAHATPGLGVVWERFPKFVLGFIAASLIFSFLIPAATVKNVSGVLNGLRTVWFALAFVAIGLEARFADLVKIEGGRPALAFIAAQFFNILWTLLWAYILFGGMLFPVPDIQ